MRSRRKCRAMLSSRSLSPPSRCSSSPTVRLRDLCVSSAGAWLTMGPHLQRKRPWTSASRSTALASRTECSPRRWPQTSVSPLRVAPRDWLTVCVHSGKMEVDRAFAQHVQAEANLGKRTDHLKDAEVVLGKQKVEELMVGSALLRSGAAATRLTQREGSSSAIRTRGASPRQAISLRINPTRTKGKERHHLRVLRCRSASSPKPR